MHTGLVTQIAYDESRSRLVTISNDKTLRIWQLPSGRLVDTLRIPIGEGSEGQLYGLALSPNGRIAAVTGWTGWEWDGRACIYFFDLESNELIARLAGLPTMAGNLTFSPDGKRLIVPLSRGFGLRVYDTSDFSIVATDTDYEDSVIGAHFDPHDGGLATTSLDGFVRLYDANFKLIAKRKTGSGEQPIAIRFSPRDRILAVGHLDRPVVALLSTRDLSPKRGTCEVV
jgi:WD40 repeat protein